MMTEKEEKNQLCAVFRDSFEYERVIVFGTKEPVTDGWSVNGVHIPYVCRYIMVGTKKLH